MSTKYRALLAMGTLVALSAYAAATAGCDDKLTSSLHECQRIVGSLRPDKAGQMRVFAPDGSEFTAGEAEWMKAQLRLVANACAAGDSVDAAKGLAEVQLLLNERQRAAGWGLTRRAPDESSSCSALHCVGSRSLLN
jgi:hypothetical protein